MQKKYYQTDSFRREAELWEKVLEQEGLPDIEKRIGEDYVLKQNSSNVYRQMDSTRREAKEIYYQRLATALLFASFDTEIDQIVMVLKAQGHKITEICKSLAAAGVGRYRRTVRLIIRKYEDRWGIRSWSPEQLKYSWKKKTLTP